MQQPEEEMTDLQKIQQMRNHLEATAQNLSTAFRDNWFTVGQITKAAGISELEAEEMLFGMQLLGLAVERRERKAQFKYKITLTRDQKLSVLRNRLEMIEKAAKETQKEIEKLADDDHN